MATFASGQVLTAAALNAIFDPLSNAWTTYTPAWTATTTNPAIGNGTILGRYMSVGKTVISTVYVRAGSTTTFGTGSYRFSMPVAASGVDAVGQNGHFGAAYYVLAGLAKIGIVRTFQGGPNLFIVADINGNDIASSSGAWATATDGIRFSCTYEAA